MIEQIQLAFEPLHRNDLRRRTFQKQPVRGDATFYLTESLTRLLHRQRRRIVLTRFDGTQQALLCLVQQHGAFKNPFLRKPLCLRARLRRQRRKTHQEWVEVLACATHHAVHHFLHAVHH